MYSLDSDLFNEISNHITYNSNKKSKDIAEFAEELPHKLRIQLCTRIYEKMYENVKFFS